jgi:hypothetical protein
MRYIDCNEDLVRVFLDIVEERFPSFIHLNIKLLFDTKKRVSAGKLVLASISTTSDMTKFFSKDNNAMDGYDFVIIVDNKAWDLASEADKRRLISHELQHIFIDEKGKAKLIGHEVEDFYQEIERNSDDPEWARNLTIQLVALYDMEKESKNKKQTKQ